MIIILFLLFFFNSYIAVFLVTSSKAEKHSSNKIREYSLSNNLASCIFCCSPLDSVSFDKIKKIETEMKSLSQDMENINTINKYREIYKYHKKNPEDKQFAEEYYSELSVYKIAAKEILENYKKLPNTKEILSKLDELQEKKNTLMQEYSLNKEQLSYLVQCEKNYKKYYGIDVER